MHLCGNTAVSWGSVNMADHARAAVADILGGPQPPAGVLVNGDCALEFGRAGDYEVFQDIVAGPVGEAGVPLHLTLGNHDHRGRFRDALRPAANDPADLACDRCASVVRGRYANFFLLDSLDDRHHLAGSIGRRQLAWLDAALGELNDRPAVVFGHHPIDPERNWLWGNISLLDGPDLWDVLDAHPHVKAYVYGHTHRWDVERRGHVHLVNLPSTAYVFDAGQPSGWVDLWLGPDGALLQLHRLRPTGVGRPGESATIEWV